MSGEFAALGEALLVCGVRIGGIAGSLVAEIDALGVVSVFVYCGLWMCEFVGGVARIGFVRWTRRRVRRPSVVEGGVASSEKGATSPALG